MIIKANGLASVDQNYDTVHYTISANELGYWEQPTTRQNSVVIEDILKLCSLPLQKKCDQYWPKEGSEHYGLIQVRLVHEEVLATYTIRKFAIRHTKVCTIWLFLHHDLVNRLSVFSASEKFSCITSCSVPLLCLSNIQGPQLLISFQHTKPNSNFFVLFSQDITESQELECIWCDHLVTSSIYKHIVYPSIEDAIF